MSKRQVLSICNNYSGGSKDTDGIAFMNYDISDIIYHPNLSLSLRNIVSVVQICHKNSLGIPLSLLSVILDCWSMDSIGHPIDILMANLDIYEYSNSATVI